MQKLADISVFENLTNASVEGRIQNAGKRLPGGMRPGWYTEIDPSRKYGKFSDFDNEDIRETILYYNDMIKNGSMSKKQALDALAKLYGLTPERIKAFARNYGIQREIRGMDELPALREARPAGYRPPSNGIPSEY